MIDLCYHNIRIVTGLGFVSQLNNAWAI